MVLVNPAGIPWPQVEHVPPPPHPHPHTHPPTHLPTPTPTPTKLVPTTTAQVSSPIKSIAWKIVEAVEGVCLMLEHTVIYQSFR